MPVEFGVPPVISAIKPGKESEGLEQDALLYSYPCSRSSARVDPGWAFTQLIRSMLCRPSTLMRRTCLDLCWGLGSGEAWIAGITTAPATSAATIATRIRVLQDPSYLFIGMLL